MTADPTGRDMADANRRSDALNDMHALRRVIRLCEEVGLRGVADTLMSDLYLPIDEAYTRWSAQAQAAARERMAARR
jgi:hypothetical protein